MEKYLKAFLRGKCPKTIQEWNWNGSRQKSCKCQHNAIKGGGSYILSSNTESPASTNLHKPRSYFTEENKDRWQHGGWLMSGGMKVAKTAFPCPTVSGTSSQLLHIYSTECCSWTWLIILKCFESAHRLVLRPALLPITAKSIAPLPISLI